MNPLSYHDRLNAYKKLVIDEALRGAQGSRVVAAERLGLSRATLHRLMRSLGIVTPRGRRGEPGVQLAKNARASAP